MVATMHRFAENPHVEMDLFWGIFRLAREPNGPAKANQFANKLELEMKKALKAAEALRDAEIGVAQAKYEIVKTNNRNGLPQIRGLIEDATQALPDIKGAYALKGLAKHCAQRKQHDRQWRKTIQLSLPKRLQKLKFYAALSSWLKDEIGITYSPNTIREEIRLASGKMSTS
jgi:hypothetical protein